MKYEPHEYQKYSVEYIKEHPIAAILLSMGLGKTSITLTAVNDLLFDSFEVHKVLCICPLRVAVSTWGAEIEKWEHLHLLQYSVAVGTEAERLSALKTQADIYIINRENVQWLIEESGVPLDYDMVVIDELSSFKNYQSKRFKALMKARPKVKRMVGLTWSLELYQQTNARLWRQGQAAETVVISHILTKGTIDERILKALKQKDTSQSALIDAVKANL